MRILLAIADSRFSEAATQAVIAQYRAQGTQVTKWPGLGIRTNILPIEVPPSSRARDVRFRSSSETHRGEVHTNHNCESWLPD